MAGHRKASFLTDLAAEFKRETAAIDVGAVQQVQFVDQGFTFVPEIFPELAVPVKPVPSEPSEPLLPGAGAPSLELAATVQLHLPHRQEHHVRELNVRKLILVSILFLLCSVSILPILHFVFNHHPDEHEPVIIQVAPGGAPGMHHQGVREFQY